MDASPRCTPALRELALVHYDGLLGGAGQPLPAPGRPAGRGLDRERAAALPVARLRLRPADRPAARRVRRRGDLLPGRGARRRRLRRAAGAGRARAHGLRRDGRDDGRLGRTPRVRHGRALQPRVRRRAAPPRRRGELSYIGIRHEGAAAFAASAYGKLTGRPAACFAIAGPGLDEPAHRALRRQARPRPGARDLRPGAVEGARPGRVPGRRPAGRVRDVAAWSQTVLPDSDHAELMSLAVKHATAAPRRRAPGPPRRGADAPGRRAPRPAGRRAGSAPSDDRPARGGARARGGAAARRAKRPVIIVGHGARGAHGRRSPRWPSGWARRCSPRSRPRGWSPTTTRSAAGVLGRSGTPVASWLMNESDLLLVFGASFANHTGIAPDKPIVQVDDDPMRSGRFHPVDGAGAGARSASRRDCSPRALEAAELAATTSGADVAERWAIWRAEKAQPRWRTTAARGRRLGRGVRGAHAALPDDAVIAVDVGNHAYSFGRYFESRGPAGADVGLPRARSASATRPRWAPGRRPTRAPGRRGHRRRRLRRSTWPSSRPRSSTACRSPTCCSTTASSARSARSSSPA